MQCKDCPRHNIETCTIHMTVVDDDMECDIPSIMGGYASNDGVMIDTGSTPYMEEP